MRASRGKRPRGLTLLEALLAAVVLAMAAAAIIMPFTAGAQSTAQDARATLAVNLAQDLMEEILAEPFRDPDGGEAGETGRSTWDDMPDYNGFAEPEGNVRSFDGVLADDPAAAGLSRRAVVQPVYVAGQDPGQPATFLRVTVEMRYRGQPLVSLSRLVYANE